MDSSILDFPCGIVYQDGQTKEYTHDMAYYAGVKKDVETLKSESRRLELARQMDQALAIN